MKRALVSLPDGVWDIIENDLRGKIGERDSEIIRNMVIGFLTQNGYLAKGEGE